MEHEKNPPTPDGSDDRIEDADAYRVDTHDPGRTDHRADDDRADIARGRNADKIGREYWLSVNFIGTLFAVGLAFMGGIGGFGLIAPILNTINEDIGPSPNINWVSLANIACGAVFFLLVGSLSDILGRRWFFVFGSCLALIGSIVGATAQSVNTLIASQVLIGIAVAFQQSFFWVVAEIVPMKYRYLANSYCYLMSTPSSPLAARVAYSFLNYPGGWRNSYYFLIAINGSSMIAWYLFYHPPTFSMLHRKRMARDLILHFDWIGFCLYSGGLLLFIFGINWGGVLYPWASGHVIATMVIGGVTLAGILPAYEIWITKRGKQSYLPIHLFKNRRFMAAAVNNGLAAGVYYGFSLVFPMVVTNLYYARGEISMYDVGTQAGLAPMGFVFAQVCHGFVEWVTGPKWGMIGSSIIGAAFLTSVSANLDDRVQTEAILVIGAFAMGLVEGLATTTATFPLRSQEEIGQGGGLTGSMRNFVSAIATAVYTATLNNRLTQTTAEYVNPVATQMGLSQSALPALANALGNKAPFSSVPGITPAIQAAVQEPYRNAFRDAAKTVFLVSLAFSGSAVILSFFTTNNDQATMNYVAGAIHGGKTEKAYNAEIKEKKRSDGDGPEAKA
ncbi:MFS general substrate transporter [Lecanosticta acicola]|uniref:MFS general substrate transporter n=1 Tax=Lecanosticta acicola TaxID=111012 RepID=A0AAI8YUU9_9PEZI|nr:MFS general substrate transporter [Lecanosticta acicola]